MANGTVAWFNDAMGHGFKGLQAANVRRPE
jgi:cold shock CspA family protein